MTQAPTFTTEMRVGRGGTHELAVLVSDMLVYRDKAPKIEALSSQHVRLTGMIAQYQTITPRLIRERELRAACVMAVFHDLAEELLNGEHSSDPNFERHGEHYSFLHHVLFQASFLTRNENVTDDMVKTALKSEQELLASRHDELTSEEIERLEREHERMRDVLDNDAFLPGVYPLSLVMPLQVRVLASPADHAALVEMQATQLKTTPASVQLDL